MLHGMIMVAEGGHLIFQDGSRADTARWTVAYLEQNVPGFNESENCPPIGNLTFARPELNFVDYSMWENLSQRVYERDYIGDVEAFEGPNFDLFHSDKTTVVIVCSKIDYENITKKRKDSDLIMIKTNPLCEVIQKK